MRPPALSPDYRGLTRAAEPAPIEEETMQSVSAFLSNQRQKGDVRRGVIAFVVALFVFFVALALSSSPSYGASPKPPKKAAKNRSKATRQLAQSEKNMLTPLSVVPLSLSLTWPAAK